MPDHSTIELRSEGVQELMGRIPPWTVRYGISVIALLIVLLIGLAALIRWPDTVSGTGVLTNSDPPRQVLARMAGRLSSIRVEEGQVVKTGDPLATIESAALPTAMDSLREYLPTIAAFQQGVMDSLPVLADMELGEGRPAWSALRNALNEWDVWKHDAYRSERNAALERKVAHFRRMITATEEQVAWARKKAVNQALEASIDTTLAGKGVIANTEFRRGQNAFLDQRISLSALETSLQQQHITLIDLQERLNELEHTDAATEREHRDRLNAANSAMESFVNAWELGYELRAPVAGVVRQATRLALQQPLEQGTALFVVVPADSTFIVEATLPALGSGKVKVGQRAHVEPEGFPHTEYGRLVGTVAHVGAVPGALGYRVSIALPAGLRTSFQRTLPFKPEMPVKVEVVTQDRSALGRVFATLRGALDR